MLDWTEEILLVVIVPLVLNLFGSWAFHKYYPTLSDYWARQSDVKCELKVKVLKAKLQGHEERRKDVVSYLSRMVFTAVVAIVFEVFQVAFTLIVIFGATVSELYPERKTEFRIMTYISIAMLFAVTYFSVYTFLRLVEQAHPDGYKRRLMERIDRLLSRVTEPTKL